MVLTSGFCIVELEYVGSYLVKDIEEIITAENIRQHRAEISRQHQRLKTTTRLASTTAGTTRLAGATQVLLIISVAGVKVTDKRGQVVIITNSLSQIDYCHYLKEDKLFCFRSRESSRFQEIHSYIHIFTTSKCEVDELNENIRNALTAAHTANTQVPEKPSERGDRQESPGTRSKTKLTKSVSAQPVLSANREQQHDSGSLNLSAGFTISPSPHRNCSPSEQTANGCLTAAEIDDLHLDVPTLTPVLTQSTVQTNTMLKHTISTQAKLGDGVRAKSKSPQLKSSISPITSSHTTHSFHQKLKVSRQKTLPLELQNLNHNTNGLRVKPILRHTQSINEQTDRHRSLRSSPSSPHSPSLTQSAPATSLSNAAEMCRSVAENYAKIGKTYGKKPQLTVSTTNNSVYTGPHAYDSENEDISAPPVPESPVYGRLQATPSTLQATPTTQSSLPPPIAFSDFSSSDQLDSSSREDNPNTFNQSDVYKDYIDIDKSPPNNNNPDTMSFYSDNYMKTGSVKQGRETPTHNENYLSPLSGGGNLDRNEKIRQSIYSTNSSSGISVTSLEGEVMMGRPLPQPPGGGILRTPTPQRYQNDSPFVNKPPTPDPNSSLLQKPSEKQQAEKQKSAEELLKQVPWFQPNMTREQVLENLSREELGSFIIRESSTHTNCFALSVKVPKFNNASGIAHYIIHRTSNQSFRIKGLEKEWTNLSSLVVHHTIMPELLPCTLKLPRSVFSRRQGSTVSNISRGSNSSGSSARSSSASPASSVMSAEGRVNNTIDSLSNRLDRTLVTTSKEAV